MQGVALLASILLAMVFAPASVAKSADPAGTRQALADFGLPSRSLKALGLLLPLAELSIAAALLFRPSARWAAVGALSLLARGKPVGLLFISPGCGPCMDMFRDVSRWQTALVDRITIALLGTGKKGELRELAEEHGLTNVLVQKDAEVFHAYHAAATPSVVIVGADGNIASQTRSTQVLVETLIRRAVRDHAAASAQPSAVSNGVPFEVRQWSKAAGPTA